MKRLIGILMVFTLAIGTIHAQDEHKKVVADWEGTLDVQGTKLRVRFHVRYNEGKLSATMDSVDQGAMGLKMDEATFKDGILTLKINQLQGTYTGKLENDELKGTWKQGPGELPLNMKKIKGS